MGGEARRPKARTVPNNTVSVFDSLPGPVDCQLAGEGRSGCHRDGQLGRQTGLRPGTQARRRPRARGDSEARGIVARGGRGGPARGGRRGRCELEQSQKAETVVCADPPKSRSLKADRQNEKAHDGRSRHRAVSVRYGAARPRALPCRSMGMWRPRVRCVLVEQASELQSTAKVSPQWHRAMRARLRRGSPASHGPARATTSARVHMRHTCDELPVFAVMSRATRVRRH